MHGRIRVGVSLLVLLKSMMIKLKCVGWVAVMCFLEMR